MIALAVRGSLSEQTVTGRRPSERRPPKPGRRGKGAQPTWWTSTRPGEMWAVDDRV